MIGHLHSGDAVGLEYVLRDADETLRVRQDRRPVQRAVEEEGPQIVVLRRRRRTLLRGDSA